MSTQPMKLSLVQEHEAREVHRTHLDTITRYIWPRDISFFETRVREEELFAVKNGNEWVGTCYVYADEHCYEFGGLYVAPAYRGSGIARVLSSVAIAMYYASASLPKGSQTPIPLIAHVHEKNPDPRGLLAKLGFCFSKQVTVPSEHAPPSMEKNPDGTITGDELLFDVKQLASMATYLENYTGALRSGTTLEIEVPPFFSGPSDKSVLVQILMDIASQP